MKAKLAWVTECRETGKTVEHWKTINEDGAVVGEHIQWFEGKYSTSFSIRILNGKPDLSVASSNAIDMRALLPPQTL